MKKVYLLLALAAMTCISVNAQVARKAESTAKHHVATVHNSALPRLGHSAGVNHTSAVIWSDDFSMPTNWSTTHSVGSSDWIIDFVGPSGPFAIQQINSTSALNGFAMFDSDA